MKSLFQADDVTEIQHRLALLGPGAKPLWGTMSVAQMLAHCSAGLDMATGSIRPQRALIGRILGPIIKRFALKDDAPMRKNSPSMPELILHGERDFTAERTHLAALIDSLYTAGPAACTTHPHAFFGPLTPEQWGILMYKHLDHHLRQFAM